MKRYSVALFIIAFIFLSLVCTAPSLHAAKKKKVLLLKKTRPARAVTTVSRPRVRMLSKDPYLGSIAVDAATGNVLSEDNADGRGYPASMVKMMTLLVILEAVEADHITLKDKITVSAEVSKIGGSQVFLKEKEVHSVDDLLYALAVQSANDAATALALHYAGSKEEFVNLMNKRAKEFGMKDTTFHSVHGLPPGKGQWPDVSTPRDMAKLSMELLQHPDALKYTSTKVRHFRLDSPEPFIMRNHNHLVGDFEGCDGLKTGYFRAGGFSIAATAEKNWGRAIVVVMGSVYSKVRDEQARKLLSKSLMQIAADSSPPSQGVTASMNEWGLKLFKPFAWGNDYLFIIILLCGFYAMRKLNQ